MELTKLPWVNIGAAINIFKRGISYIENYCYLYEIKSSLYFLIKKSYFKNISITWYFFHINEQFQKIAIRYEEVS